MTTHRVLIGSTSHHGARDQRGPWLWIAAAAVALVVTVLADTVVRDLGRHGTSGYDVSGFFMTLADVLLLLGVVALVRSDVVSRRGWRAAAGLLAVAGSAGAVVAEILLRFSFDIGTAVFSVAGPAQALGFIALGIAIVVGRAWSGWRRYALLAVGMYVPLILVPSLAAGHGQNLVALGGFHAGWLAVGLAWSRESGSRSEV